MKLRLLILIGLFTPTLAGVAGSIDWGSSVQDKLYDANGAALTSGYQFELGTFADGFVPDASNTDLWEANWKLIEQASFNAPMQYVAENSILTNTGPWLTWERDQTGDETAPLMNANLFAPNEQVYVWAFNGKTVDSTTQWALLTGNGVTQDTDWQLTTGLGEPTATTRQWRLSNADTAVFGGLNGTQGGGTVNTTPGIFSLQTALVFPIPEPSATALPAAVSLFVLRRRRSANSLPNHS